MVVLEDKIKRRYRYGIPRQGKGSAFFGDATTTLQKQSWIGAALLLTSPPYCGVTDYWNDHWIRLWILGYGLRKNWRKSAKFEGQGNYLKLLLDVFGEGRRHLVEGAAVLVRSDLRRRTAEMCMTAIMEVWPEATIYARATVAPKPGESIYHGHGGHKAREVDFLLPGVTGRKWCSANSFRVISSVDDLYP